MSLLGCCSFGNGDVPPRTQAASPVHITTLTRTRVRNQLPHLCPERPPLWSDPMYVLVPRQFRLCVLMCILFFFSILRTRKDLRTRLTPLLRLKHVPSQIPEIYTPLPPRRAPKHGDFQVTADRCLISPFGAIAVVLGGIALCLCLFLSSVFNLGL